MGYFIHPCAREADRKPEERRISPEELERAQAAIRLLSSISLGPTISTNMSRSGATAGSSRSSTVATEGDSRSRSVAAVGGCRSRSGAAAGGFTLRSDAAVCESGSTLRSDVVASDGGSTSRNGAGGPTTSAHPGPSSGKIMQGVIHITVIA